MRRQRTFETLEQRTLLAATIVEHNEIVYVFSESDPRVDRYSLASEQWISPLTLPNLGLSLTAAVVTDAEIIVSNGRELFRVGLDGGGEIKRLENISATAMFADGDIVLVQEGAASIRSISATSLRQIDAKNLFRPATLSSLAPGVNRIFGRTTNEPSEIVYQEYGEDGSLLGFAEGPTNHVSQNATQTWLFPDEAQVIDDFGRVYAVDDLELVGNIGTGVDDVAFPNAERAIVLTNQFLRAYATNLEFVGGVSLDYTPERIFVNDARVITFTLSPESQGGFRVRTVDLELLNLLPAGDTAEPVELSFLPHQVELANDGTLLILSNVHRTLFRWDPGSQSFTQSIRLFAAPHALAYSAAANVVYLSYASGLIQQLDLDAPEVGETFFAQLARPVDGLAMAGEYLYAASGITDRQGNGGHYVLRPDGTIADTSRRDRATAGFAWSDAKQRMYFLTSDPFKVYWEEINANGVAYPGEAPGAIRNRLISPGPFFVRPPIRLRTDGQVGWLGSSQVFDADLLTWVGYAGGAGGDVAWLGTDLYSIHTVGGQDVARVVRHSGENYEQVGAIELPGAAVAIRRLDDERLVVITRQEESPPAFYVLDANLSPIKALPGDTNFDGQVDLSDLNNVRNRFGEMGHGDADADGDIDLEDLNAVRNFFGTSSVNGQEPQSFRHAVPELSPPRPSDRQSIVENEVDSSSLHTASATSANLKSATDAVFELLHESAFAATRKIRRRAFA